MKVLLVSLITTFFFAGCGESEQAIEADKASDNDNLKLYTVSELEPLLLRGHGPGMTKQKLKELWGPPDDTEEKGMRWIYKKKVKHPDTEKPEDLYILIQMGQSLGTGFNYDEIISFKIGQDGQYFVGWAN